jgi:PemK-like, MazF-like toxin of type II toxin-antitoxin system
MNRSILKAIIPYVEGSNVKARPVIQLSEPGDENYNFQVVYLTSKKPNSLLNTDIEIIESHIHFYETGLSKTSYIRVSKIFTIDPSMVQGVLGHLPIVI